MNTSYDLEEGSLPLAKSLGVKTSEVSNPDGQSSDRIKGLNSLIIWAVVALCALVNLLIVVESQEFNPALFDPIFSLIRQQYTILRQPSSSEHKGYEPGKKLSYPSFVAQVNLPNRHYLNRGGPDSSEVRIQVTEKTSTIVQFAPVDLGIYPCELRLRYFSNESQPSNPAGDPFQISIYQLDARPPLEFKPDWQTAIPPPRMTNIDTIQVIPGVSVDWSALFSCATDEVPAFEIACLGLEDKSTSNCLIDWQQQREYGVHSSGVSLFRYTTD